MRKSTSIVLIILSFSSFAQDNTFLWPIKGKEKGENTLFQPQDYIGREFNFGNLIIHAPEGTNVLAPTDGEVISFNYVYFTSMERLSVYRHTPMDYQKDIEAFKKDWNPNNDIRFLSVSLRVRLEDGKHLSVSGLRPTRTFRTGEKVKRGDPIGTVGYFYQGVPQPSISISISNRNGIPSDPMLPFGLKTTFKEPEARKVKTELTAEEAEYDFTLLVNSLKEGFPGLFDFVSEEDFNDYVSQTLESFQTPVKTADFYRRVATLLRKIRDNHLSILSADPTISGDIMRYIPTVSFGWLNGELILARTTVEYEKYRNLRITEINGVPGGTVKKEIISYLDGIEGNVESYRDFLLMINASFSYAQNSPKALPKRDISLTFENGENVLFPGRKTTPKTLNSVLPDFNDFWLINSERVSLEKLSDETAYLGISTFFLNELEMEQIADFITSIIESNYQYFIIDVRNNPGGCEEVAAKIFSFIAQQPFSSSKYSQVTKKGNFDLFQHSTNYADIDTDIFPEYSTINGKNGYFLYNEEELLPNDSVNFRGNVYILTNERSMSASANLASLVHKHRRGVIVGRETGSAYHQMKALKTAFLRLPNSQIDINLPLVKIVFDTCTEVIPFGRGVLPDYELSLSMEELSFENGDLILNYVQQLIMDGHYLIGNESIIDQKKSNWYIYLFLVVGCGIIVYIIIRGINKRYNKGA